MIYADFESILVPKDNVKQNQNESFSSKYQKHVACSYGYKLVCVDDKVNMSFKSYLDEDAVYSFIYRVIEKSKYCSDVIKTNFNKLVIKEVFENSSKCWICDDDYIDKNV